MAQDDLWRELLAVGRVRWMAGMSAVGHPLYPSGLRVDAVGDDGRLWGSHCGIAPDARITPDWSDPATRGCLLALAREAWGDSGLYAVGKLTAHKRQWAVLGGHPHGSRFRRMSARWHDTEAEALLAAIEAA